MEQTVQTGRLVKLSAVCDLADRSKI